MLSHLPPVPTPPAVSHLLLSLSGLREASPPPPPQDVEDMVRRISDMSVTLLDGGEGGGMSGAREWTGVDVERALKGLQEARLLPGLDQDKVSVSVCVLCICSGVWL